MRRPLAVALVVLLLPVVIGAQEDRFFVSDGARIHYIEQGEGPPVLLLHGFTGSAATTFGNTGITPALARDFRVIAMDIRGHGRSDKPHRVEQYGTALLDDITRLLDHLRVRQIDVVGFSMGGELALSYVIAHPERVRRAVVSGAGLVRQGDPKHAMWKAHGDLLAKPSASFGHLEFPGFKIDPATIPATDKANDLKALSAIALGMLRLHVDEGKLRANRVPLLFLIGELDPFKPGADAAVAVDRNAKMVILPGRDHLNTRNDPGFSVAIRDFLRE